MSKFTVALDDLKREIAEINTNSAQMKRVPFSQKQMKDHEQNFVNPDLLPEFIEVPKGSIPESTSYSNNVLQAIWNIADIVASVKSFTSVAGLIANPKSLTQNFEYLDSSWVPKIINEKTYKAGNALLNFLNVVLNDKEIFEEFPLNYVPQANLNEIKDELNRLKTVLEQRIKVYETFTPQKLNDFLDQQTRLDKLKTEREVSYGTLIRENLLNLNKQVNQNSLQFKKESIDSIESLTNTLSVLENQKKRLEKNALAFHEDIENGLAKLEGFIKFETNEYYDKIYSYKFMLDFQGENLPEYIKTDSTEKIISSWENLFNGNEDSKSLNINEINVLNELTKYDIKDSKSISTAIKNANEQIGLIKGKIEFVKQLESFRQDLIAKLKPVIEKPQTIIVTDGIPKSDNPENALKENIAASNDHIKELTSYSAQLSDQYSYLKEQLSNVEERINLADEIPLESKDAYKSVSQDLFETKLKTVEGEQTLLKGLLQTAKEKKNSFELDLSKLSAVGRSKVLKVASDRIKVAFDAHSHARYKEIKVTSNYPDFVQSQYEPAKQAINQNYNPKISLLESQINGTNKTINKLEESIRSRREFLTEAITKLKNFVGPVNPQSYIDLGKMPEAELINYLELDTSSPEAQELNEMYSTAQDGYIKTWLRSYSIGIHPYDLNRRDWEDRIRNKIEIMRTELEINDLTTKIEKPKSLETRSNESLYDLSVPYSIETSFLAEKTKEWSELSAEKNIQLKVWDDKDALNVRIINQLQFSTQLEKAENQIAVIALDTIKLEYLLDEIEQKQSDVSDRQSYKKIDLLGENSATLNKKIRDNLSDQNKILKSLESADLPIAFRERLESQQHEVEALTRKNTEFSKKIVDLTSLIKVTEIEKVFTDLKTNMEKFIKTNPNELNLAQANQSVTDKIEPLQNVLDNYGHSSNLKVQETLTRIQNLKEELEAFNLIEAPDTSIELPEELPIIENKKPVEVLEIKKFLVNKVPVKNNKPVESAKNKIDLVNVQYIEGFGDYLKKRAENHWFKDYCSNLAALFLGYFDYKSSAQEREEYLTELSTVMTDGVPKIILNKIDLGLSQFSPEALLAEDSDSELSQLLTTLKTEYEKISLLYDAEYEVLMNDDEKLTLK
ncbi:MAG: hypothetical protein H0U57_14400 [Tatlockia sp.]|nr:hypothetical protein [Tatlockia sp.]